MALIRKKDVNDDDYATAFTFNVLTALCFYLILFFTAPLISTFYNNEQITPILRVLALSLVINSFGIVQNTQLMSGLKFKYSTKISIISSLSSGTLSILFAILGLGVWTIVLQSIIYSLLNSSLLYYYIHWRPRFYFSKHSFNYLFKFGINIQLTNILNSIYNNIYNLIIGKFYTATDLGLYSRGNSIAILIPNIFLGIFSKISLPVLSKIQDEEERLQNALCKLISTIAFLIFPIMGLLTVLAPPFIMFFLGEKWMGCTIYIQLFAITTCLTPVSSLNQAVPLIKGRSDYTFKIELIKKGLSVIGICIMIPFGIKPLAIFASIWNIITYIIDIYFTNKLIHLSPYRQFLICIRPIVSTCIMGILIHFTIRIVESNLLKLITGVIEGLVIYYIINRYITRNPIIHEIQSYYESITHSQR